MCRLPGRNTLVKEMREAFDCGERPEFDVCELDIHSIASLLKLYLRELPESVIPVQFYDALRKIVIRDVQQSPVKAFERLYQLLTNIPQHNYNLLQYVCKFLQDVASHSGNNKMTPMNLATVFAPSVVRPESDDPAILMGTANARNQILFVLISEYDRIFRLEYTTQGGSVRVDDLVTFGDDNDDGWGSNVYQDSSSVVQSASFQNDLMGLELTSSFTGIPENTINTDVSDLDPCQGYSVVDPLCNNGHLGHGQADAEEPLEALVDIYPDVIDNYESVPDSLCDSAQDVIRQDAPNKKEKDRGTVYFNAEDFIRDESCEKEGSPDSVYDTPHNSGPDVTCQEESSAADPLYDTAQSCCSDVKSQEERGADPLYDITESCSQDVPCTQERSPEDEEPHYARVNLDKKVHQRSLKHRSMTVYSEAKPSPPLGEDGRPPLPPQPPPRLAPRPFPTSTSSIDSQDAVPIPESSVEDDQAFEDLINVDMSGSGVDNLLTHIQTLCLELHTQRSKVTELSKQQRELKRRHMDKVHKLAQKLDHEKTATANAVERIMSLQTELQQYQMRYGPLQ